MCQNISNIFLQFAFDKFTLRSARESARVREWLMWSLMSD